VESRHAHSVIVRTGKTPAPRRDQSVDPKYKGAGVTSGPPQPLRTRSALRRAGPLGAIDKIPALFWYHWGALSNAPRWLPVIVGNAWTLLQGGLGIFILSSLTLPTNIVTEY